MKAILVALAVAATPLPQPSTPTPAFDSLPESGAPVACSDPDTLWDLLEAEEHHDAVRLAKLMHSRCRSLTGVHYTLEQQRNGVSRIRVFPVGDSWSTSCVVYTLDEMIAPEQVLTRPEPQHVPTGWTPAYILPPTT
jgi:hypothetical protein